MSRFLIGLILAITLSPPAPAADWPQFLGPTRDNASTETVSAWTGELKPAWKVPVGSAHSSPVVAHGLVYAFYQPGKKAADALAAYDLKTGDKKWEKSYDRDPFDPLFGAGPRGTPAVVGDDVFTLGGTGVLARWDAKTGDLKWKVDTLREFKVDNLFFGVSGSPLVGGGKVFVNVGGKGAGVVAFDRNTGKVAWKATDDGASYSSPTLAKFGGKEQLVVLTKQFIRAFDPATGAVLWKHPFRDPSNESATAPLAVGDELVCSSVTLGSVLLKPAADSAKVVWAKRGLNCYFSTPTAVGSDLYMLNGVLKGITPSVTLRCVELATGKVRWEKPNVGNFHAAVIRTGNGKLLMLDDNGYLTLFQPDEKEFKQLARTKVCGPTWAHPALSDGRLVIRDEKDLLCFEMAK
ncbi:MAG TPA: PQQ-binding-like beta-propeller repeat protein [Fimbriiglobus sp.]|jgi:outer membrane protein assembly factor BamB